ncbi:poly-gamma-glutamate synthesis protein (capsule biosynthesis protein) [Paenibacillus sp. DS2015]|uniref:CapA family protein n=1 Tax=Paenibacillus sp. DS2015 TaxID=3373917 RepID=UPI003D228A99
MYPPRSQKNQAQKKGRQKRKLRVWGWLNVSLIVMIAIILLLMSLEKDLSPSVSSPVSSSLTTNKGSDDGSTQVPSESKEPAGLEDEKVQDSADTMIEQQPEVEQSKDTVPSKGHAPTQKPVDTRSSRQESEDVNPTLPADVIDVEDIDDQVESDEKLTFHFAGDMIFSGKVEDQLKKNGYSYPFEHLGDMFLKDDLTFANLETPVTTMGVGALNKQFVFKSSPEALEAIKQAGIDAVSLANNHILDQGESGLLDTLEYLDKSGVEYAGAGKNAAEAYAPKYFTRKGVNIALVSASRVVPVESWYAGKDKPGVAQAYNPDQVISSIAEARKNADIVIVMAHWGKEKATVLEDHQTTLAHSFVDAGADLVIGGHPHVLQGLEQYKGKWIAYSTGNFIFTKSTTEATWKTAVFETTCTKTGKCEMKLIPFHAEIGQPVPMLAADGEKLMKEVQDISVGNVTINKEGKVKSE